MLQLWPYTRLKNNKIATKNNYISNNYPSNHLYITKIPIHSYLSHALNNNSLISSTSLSIQNNSFNI